MATTLDWRVKRLSELDRRTREIIQGDGYYDQGLRDTWTTDYKLSTDDIEMVLRAVPESNDLMLLPDTVNLGLQVGFSVMRRVGHDIQRVVTFSEAQLPAGYDWKTLGEVFLSPENRRRAAEYSIHISSRRSAYDHRAGTDLSEKQ